MNSAKEKEAIALAKKTNKTVFINRHVGRDQEFLFLDDFRGGECCGKAQPNGDFERIVQAPQRFGHEEL